LGLPWVERGRRTTDLPDGADADKESWDGTERVVMIPRNSALCVFERWVRAAVLRWAGASRIKMTGPVVSQNDGR